MTEARPEAEKPRKSIRNDSGDTSLTEGLTLEDRSALIRAAAIIREVGEDNFETISRLLDKGVSKEEIGKRLERSEWLQAFRHLEEGGPPTFGQKMAFLVENCNCTPLEAVRELKENERLNEMVEAMNFTGAYRWIERYQREQDGEDEREPETPHGEWVDKVHEARDEYVDRKYEEQEEQLEGEDRK